jgi:branched-chain amino acid transport system permease protein
MIPYAESLLIFTSLAVILASSLNLMLGYGGMFSAAHAVFYGIGAYTASLLALHVNSSILLCVPAAMIAGGVAGALLAVPALRVKEEYFVVASLGFQVIASTVFNQWVAVTGGIGGLTGIPPASFMSIQVDSYGGYLVLALLCAAGVLIALKLLVRSEFGRALRALRDDEAALQALGRDPVRLRVATVVIAAMLAAIAGAIYAYFTSFVNPESFSLDESILIMVMVIIGGTGTLTGPVLGAVFITTFPALLSFVQIPSTILGPTQRVVYGAVITLLMIYEPEGLLGFLRRISRVASFSALRRWQPSTSSS